VITNATFGDGRLGNQLFQLGVLFAVAAKTGHRFGLPRGAEQLWQCFELDVPAVAEPITNVFREGPQPGNFSSQVFHQPDGTAFVGHYQSWRYYEHCRPELKSFLKFQAGHQDVARSEVERLRSAVGLPLASVHYRRTDYLDATEDLGSLHADGYYDRVFDRLGDDVMYVVFSDDLSWCRDNVRRRHVAFADFDPYVSLCMMTLCDVNVIANSTFSWWGAFLNQMGGTVFTPSRWFRRMIPHAWDMAPPDWVKIRAFDPS
jgi:hypothetical protein